MWAGVFLLPMCVINKKTLRPIYTHAEGFILGVGAKMFTIAGPVIVYGIFASTIM